MVRRSSDEPVHLVALQVLKPAEVHAALPMSLGNWRFRPRCVRAEAEPTGFLRLVGEKYAERQLRAGVFHCKYAPAIVLQRRVSLGCLRRLGPIPEGQTAMLGRKE
jgi:hypothetical protein